MEYESKPCKVVTTFETYEECAQYIIKSKVRSESQMKASYHFEKYFVKILREYPVLYDENNHQFGHEFPTKHAWSIVAGFMMMERKAVQELWTTFQKFASSGVQLYVDLVNYVKLGDGNRWIDADPDSGEEDGNSATTKEDEGDFAVKKEDSLHVKVEVVSPVKTETDLYHRFVTLFK